MGVFQLPIAILLTTVFISKAFALHSSNMSDPNACAALASQSRAQQAIATPTFKPSAVYACLQEVPINATLVAQQIEWYENYLQFLTTTAYLKNPPPAYEPSAVDLFSGLNDMKVKALAGQYANEYEFELALYNLVAGGRDSHFVYKPWLIGNFGINRNVELVSISLDGAQLPKVYFYSDVLANVSGNATFTPSAVSAIDKDNVTNRLVALGYDQRYQDNDAQFNMLFAIPIVISPTPTPQMGAFKEGLFTHHNDSTSYTFENGSTTTIPNSAYADFNLTITSGQDLFNRILLNAQNLSASSLTDVQPSSQPLTLPGYPQPVPGAASPGAYVSGYFLQDVADTAVLVMTNFSPGTYSNQLGFQAAIRNFLKACRAYNKQRLIIDIRQNVGGLPDLVYDTFGQLFPTLKPYSGTRIRTFDAANAVGEVFSNLSSVAETQVLQALAQQGGALTTVPYFGPSYLQENGAPFPSWADFYGPVEVYGDHFSHIGAYKLSNSTITAPLTISGAATNSTPVPQPFASTNIILLTDGTCQSACAYFANLLMNQGNVTTVAVGGRPDTTPMAVIGGTQGGEDLSVSTIQVFIGITQKLAALSNNTNLIAGLNRTLSSFLKQPPIPPVNLDAVTFNVRDNIAKGDESQTPLQFTRSPNADCRTFYMAGDILNVTYTWNRVAKGLAANGKGLCINGTITDGGTSPESSISDGVQTATAGAAALSSSSKFTFEVITVVLGTTLPYLAF